MTRASRWNETGTKLRPIRVEIGDRLEVWGGGRWPKRSAQLDMAGVDMAGVDSVGMRSACPGVTRPADRVA
jgi:hypothetical protein